MKQSANTTMMKKTAVEPIAIQVAMPKALLFVGANMRRYSRSTEVLIQQPLHTAMMKVIHEPYTLEVSCRLATVRPRYSPWLRVDIHWDERPTCACRPRTRVSPSNCMPLMLSQKPVSDVRWVRFGYGSVCMLTRPSTRNTSSDPAVSFRMRRRTYKRAKTQAKATSWKTIVYGMIHIRRTGSS